MDVNPTRMDVAKGRLRRAGAAAWSTRYDGTTWLFLGSLVAGLAAYGLQVVGGRTLGSHAFGPIATLWTVQYLVIAIVLFTVEQYVVRTVAARGGDPSSLRRASTLLWGVIFGAALVAGVVLFILADEVLLSLPVLALVSAIWIVVMGALAITRGIAGGRGAYRVAGVATGSDSLTRFLVALPALALFGSTLALAWSLPVGSVPFLVWWWVRGRREIPARDVPAAAAGGTGRFLAATAAANGTLQLLLGAGPLGVAILGASTAEMSAFFITTTLARAPMLIGIGLVPRLLTPLTRRAEAGDYAHVRGLAWLVALGALSVAAASGVLAGLFGPDVIALLYGDEYAVSGPVTGAAVATVAVALGALALNQVLLAENRPIRLIPPWAAALAVAVVVTAVLPLDPLPAVAYGALAGQVLAICGLAVAITTTPVPGDAPEAAE